MACEGDLYVFGNIACSGTKNRIVETEHFGKIAMNAMESASAYFTDIGSGYITGDKCYIYFDEKYDYVIGNPPFDKLKSSNKMLNTYKKHAINKDTNNICSFFLLSPSVNKAFSSNDDAFIIIS